MKLHFDFDTKHLDNAEVKVLAAYSKKDGGIAQSWSQKDLIKQFNMVKSSKNFKASSPFLASCKVCFNFNNEIVLFIFIISIKLSSTNKIFKNFSILYKTLIVYQYTK